MTRYNRLDALPERLALDTAFTEAAACVRDLLSRDATVIADVTRHLAQSGGKGIRMRLLLSAAADDNNETPLNAVRAAAAVEIFHLATLVHDDVIDDAPLRRGVETVQSRFGKKAAVIGGDYLLCLAMSLMPSVLDERFKDRYSDIMLTVTKLLGRVCIGEYRQCMNHGSYGISVYDYLKTISGKTAALFTLSAYAGAELAECADARRLARFGNYVGMIFQIMDDCKDYEQSEQDAQKPVGYDAASGVATLPLILALAKEPRLKQLTASVMGGAVADGLVREVCRLGGVTDAKAVAARYAGKARKLLDGLNSQTKKTELNRILLKALGECNG